MWHDEYATKARLTRRAGRRRDNLGPLRAIARSGGVLTLCALAIAGCGGDPPGPKAPSEARAEAPSAPQSERAPAPAAEPATTLAELAIRVGAQAEAFRAGAPARRAKLLAQVDEGKVVAGRLYAPGRLLFYKGDGNLSDDGAAVMALLAGLERHAVATRPYRLDAVDRATAAVVQAFAEERKAIVAMAPTQGAARVALAMARWLRSGQGGELELVRAAGGELDADALRALGAGLDALHKASTATRVAIWAADVEIARCAVRYWVDFRLARPLDPLETMSPATIRRLADKHADAVVAALASQPGQVAAGLQAAWPSNPQYQALLAAHDRYRALAAAGGWEKLPKMAGKSVAKGASGPFVAALRTRLAAEGYDVAAGDRFDDALELAIKSFQRRHQLDDDGVVSASTVRELDHDVSFRVGQIGIGLGRWREANARDPENFHVWVNVAAQLMQVFENGKPIREHRVIVGKDNEDIDYERRIKGKINRTKLFKAKMNKITLAPRWYPTPRVIDIELGPALAKDPDYYEKHGYVSTMNADGTETVYQRAGPTNLLGMVKFQFPNKHAIYMHDTPSRFLFSKSRRAYSHGCIRMEEPVALANFLLMRDKGWNKAKIKKIIDEREEKVVMLKNEIAVYIDYVTVSVDTDGAVQFWSDIYDYDHAHRTGQLPVQEVEEYKAASTKGLL